MDISGKAKLTKQTTIGDLEVTSLNPKTEGRIRLLNPKVSRDLIFYLYIYVLYLSRLLIYWVAPQWKDFFYQKSLFS